MIWRISGVVLFLSFCAGHAAVAQSRTVYPYAIPICAVIINEMSEGRVSLKDAREVALAIAHAGNEHFGRVTCGDMWLYMAIVYVESGFKNNIINAQNCHGMFQVHAPSWARKFGVKYSDLLKPETNAHCGIGIFKYYLHLYKTLVPALSAYNSDHPRAAIGYAGAVLSVRRKIRRRYTELYHVVHNGKRVAYQRPM
jgi:hypothetical protein